MRTLLFLPLVILVAQAASADSAMNFQLIDNRVFVPVTVNGEGPFSFVLDTGASGWTLSTPTARQLKLAATGNQQVEGVGEAQETAADVKLSKITLGPLHFADQPAVAEDFAALANVIGFQHFDGIAGRPVFARAVVDLDFDKSRVQLLDASAYAAPAGATAIPFGTYEGFMPLVDGEVAGIQGKFIVDLGDRFSLTLFGPFWRSHHLDDALGPGIVALTGYGVGGPVKGEVVRVKQFALGGVPVKGVVARLSLQKSGGFTDASIAGSIGAGILKRFHVAFDYARSRIVLSPEHDAAEPYDRSGLWLGRAGKLFRVVDVVPGSPAADAGIKAGDEITAVDGAPVQTLDLFATRAELADPARPAVTLTFSRGDSSSTATLALRDLVPQG